MLRWYDYSTAFLTSADNDPLNRDQGQRLSEELAAACTAATPIESGRACLYSDMAGLMAGDLDLARLRSKLDTYATASFEQARLADFSGQYFYAHADGDAARSLWSLYLPEGMLIYRAHMAVMKDDWDTASVLVDAVPATTYEGSRRAVLAQVLVEMAGRALSERDYAGAEQYLRRAIQQWPDRPTYYVSLSRALGGQQRWAESATVLEEAIRLRPDFAQYHVFKAQALLHDHQIELARNAALHALELDPNNQAAQDIVQNLENE
jgi:tetratricopeptide (TPR) repeat protein